MMVSSLLHRLSEDAKAWWDKQALQADWELERQIRLTFPEDAADYVASSFGSSAARALKALRLQSDFNPIPPQQPLQVPVPLPPAGLGSGASSDLGDRCGN